MIINSIQQLNIDDLANINDLTSEHITISDIDVSQISETTQDIIVAVYNTTMFQKLVQLFIQVNRIRTEKTPEKAHEDFWNFSLPLIDKKFKAGMSSVLFKPLRQTCIDTTKRTKKSWIKFAMDSVSQKKYKLLYAEYIERRKDYIKTGIMAGYNISTPEQLIEFRNNWFHDWLKPCRYLSEYPYMAELTDKKVSRAFELDLINCITTIIKDEYSSDIGRIKRTNLDTIKSGIFVLSTKRKTNPMQLTTIDKKVPVYESSSYSGTNEDGNNVNLVYNFNGSKLISDKVKATNFTIDPSPMSEDDIEEIDSRDLVNQIFSRLTLDYYDLKMIRYAVNETKGQKVRVYFKDLLKELGLSRGSKNYNMLELKLLKLPTYTVFEFEEAENEVKKRTYNFFSEVKVTSDDAGQVYADIILSPSTEDDIKNATQRVYYKELRKLKYPQSENLAYFLEGERNKYSLKGDNLECESYTYSIDILKLYVNLSRKKTLRQNMDILDIGINEICTNNFIIKSYKRNKDSFEIKFYPDEEIRKNLITSTYYNLPEYIKK